MLQENKFCVTLSFSDGEYSFTINSKLEKAEEWKAENLEGTSDLPVGSIISLFPNLLRELFLLGAEDSWLQQETSKVVCI